MCINKIYILVLHYGIQSMKNILLMTPEEEKGSISNFTLHEVIWVIFLMKDELIYYKKKGL